MDGNSIWMVRAGKNGVYAGDFVEDSFVGIGFSSAGEVVTPITRIQLESQIRNANPSFSPGKIGNVASQVKRFYEEVEIGNQVMTYDPSQRLYYLGEVLSDVVSRDHELSRSRSVQWTKQTNRDALTASTRNSLGSILTLFLVRDDVADDLLAHANPIGHEEEVPEVKRPRIENLGDEAEDDVEARASELIDDMIANLNWSQLQQLVAEILEAMGYRAEVSDKGPDRGVDVFASPDGLGLQEPRIFVEVKHRPGTRIGSEHLRSFIGGRQSGDRCLYVSTGGFTKEAKYEAERSNVPVTLIALPKLRELVLEHYNRLSPAGLALVPLKQIYWPVS